MHDGDVIGIDAFPIRQPIEQGDGRRGEREQCRSDAVFLEQSQEVWKVSQT